MKQGIHKHNNNIHVQLLNPHGSDETYKALGGKNKRYRTS